MARTVKRAVQKARRRGALSGVPKPTQTCLHPGCGRKIAIPNYSRHVLTHKQETQAERRSHPRRRTADIASAGGGVSSKQAGQDAIPQRRAEDKLSLEDVAAAGFVPNGGEEISGGRPPGKPVEQQNFTVIMVRGSQFATVIDSFGQVATDISVVYIA